MKVTAANYARLKAFFVWWVPRLFENVPMEESPLATLDAIEGRSMAMARRGLGDVIGDIVEMLDRLSPEKAAAADQALAAEGIITLSAVRAGFSKRIRAIMRRGKLRDESEYYSLRSAADALADDDRQKAWDMLGAYETGPALDHSGNA